MMEEHLEGFRLSPQQRRLWRLLEAEPRQPFRSCLVLRLEGVLDRGRLTTAFRELVDRHEILRTVFRCPANVKVPLQVITENGTVPIIDLELGTSTPSESEEILDRFFAQSFDLETGPNLRLGLFSQSAVHHLVLLSLPSLAADRPALEQLAAEFALLYGSQAAEELSEEPLQYADFAEWQNELLESEEMAGGKEFWENKAVPPRPEVTMPFVDRQPVADFVPQMCSRVLSRETTAAIEAMPNVSPETFLLSCWATLLWRFIGAEELVVGTTFFGRKYEELKTAVGLLARTLPLPVRPHFGMNLLQLTQEVQQTLTEFEVWHEHFTWEEAGSDLTEPPPWLAFGFEFHQSLEGGQEREAKIGIERCFSLVERFDLQLSCVAGPQVWHLELHYDSNRLSEDYAARIAEALLTMIDSVLRAPEKDLAELRLLSAAECDHLLSELAESTTGRPLDCVHHLIEQQASRVKDRVAICYEGEDLSYGEFVRRSALVAARLERAGVGRESVVGLLGERSLNLFVGLLGILQAGGAYLPLDPSLPRARLRQMLKQAGTEVVLSDGTLIAEVEAIGQRTVALDISTDAAAEPGGEEPRPAMDPGNLAYILFTSGSTGTPKAVAVEHQNVSNYVLSLLERLRLEDGAVFATVSPIATDLGNTMIFGALASGGRLHVIAEERAADPEALGEYCRHRPIDCLKIVPSHLTALLSSGSVQDLLPKRLLMLGGEASSWELIRRLRNLGTETRLLNHYGPTETTVGVTVYPIPETAESAQTTVSLGTALANARLYPTDRSGHLVPVGVPGELQVGGPPVSRGYLGAPGLTAERFCPDPFSDVAGARLYQTGDLVRSRPDGNLEFLGRMDHQVKIRGFRIELGEIEATLGQSPAVQQAAVLLKPGPAGDQRLVAYLVPDPQRALPVWKWLEFEKEGRLEEGQRYELPNGMIIAHLNAGETEYLYREIFKEQSYLRHGIDLADGDCIFDVGANIGMFSLSVGNLWADAEIYAFEPAPLAFETLKINAELYGLNVKAFECGLAGEARLETFTYYPHASMQSSLHADVEEEREVVRSFVLAEQPTDKPLNEVLLDELLEERLESWEYSVPLRTLSELIREQGVGRIDLLKIDVQKSEAEVLAGLEEDDWPKVQQIVVEVHDLDGRLEQIRALLESKGYDVSAEQETVLSSTPLVTLYARRVSMTRATAPVNEEAGGEVGTVWRNPRALVNDVKEFVRAGLPEAMVPSVFVLLDALPRMKTGKIDRHALPEPREERQERNLQPPTTKVEKVLAGVWAEVLGLEEVGVNEDFFELGGHSLLATQVVSRLRRTFGVELSLRHFLETPTIAGLAQGFEALQESGAVSLRAAPVEPVPRDRDLPLSFAQQRLWFLAQFDPLGTAYNITLPVRFRGPVNLSAFRHALDEIVRRHEVLRTVFRSEDGSPVQVIQPPRSLNVAEIDLMSLPSALRRLEVRRLIGREAGRPFDLSRDSMLRASLVRLGLDDQAGIFSMHHIACDEWSGGLLLREVAVLYDAFSQGRPSPLPELQVQYGDFAFWQHRWLTGEILKAEIEYWLKQLDGLPPVMQVAADRPRPAVQSSRGGHHHVVLSAELSTELTALSRRQSATLFTTLLAGYKALLRRHTGQNDICVGSLITGRRHLETEELIGFFVNTLVLRTRVKGGLDFHELVAQVREVWLQADLHQDVPFERLVEELQPVRSRQHSPLFQVAFNYQNTAAPHDLASPSELQLEALGTPTDMVLFDLTLTVREGLNGIHCNFEYSTDLFDATTIHRMASHFEVLLESFVANPKRPIGEIDGIRSSERSLLLTEWNDTAWPARQAKRLEELIAARVDHHPDALAIISTGRALSYRAFDERANQLAHALRDLGIGAEDVVALLAERTLELPVGMLGILKAGGAFLPLEPSNPNRRLEDLVRDSGASVMLTLESLVDRVSVESVKVLCLDTDWPKIGRQSVARPVPLGNAESLAYLLFTSGSTGRPKGVLVSHRALASDAQWSAARQRLGPDDRVLQFASPAFDLMLEETFPSWIGDGAVVQVPTSVLTAPLRLAETLEMLRVTATDLPPAYWHEFTAALENADRFPPSSLRLMRLGSEMPSLGTLARWQRFGVPVLHCFGLTETTITSCTFEVAPEGPVEFPIGRPVTDTHLYVLDKRGVPAPYGVPGELLIGGEHVARGYQGQAALTAERFVPDPWTGGRLYRSGDLVRFRSDGNLEYMGRIDDQVKIRGIRVEPGEVEVVLKQHPLLLDGAVVARKDSSDNYQLVAYGVPVEGETISLAELRPWLSERLPVHMIPAIFMMLEALPVRAYGKVDHSALPTPERDRQIPNRSMEPSSPTERALAEIWSEVLATEQVGLDESFFELGGHSLVAIQVVSRVREKLGLEIDLIHFFDAPTVREMAAALDRSQPRAMTPLPKITRRPAEAVNPPLSLAQRRLWFLNQLNPESSLFNISGGGRLQGAVDLEILNRSLNEMVRRHEILRTSFSSLVGEPMQVIQPYQPITFPVTDLSHLPLGRGLRVAYKLAAAIRRHPFDLAAGQLLRVHVLRLAPADYAVVYVLHHIISDEWSMGIFAREMGAIYSAFGSGQPSPLPELPIQYGDYAWWQEHHLQGKVMEQQLAYWRQQLEGAPSSLELPTDQPRPPWPTERGASVPVRLSQELNDRLGEFKDRAEVTRAMVVLAAFQALLSRYCAQQEILVGLPTAGRHYRETEDLIGFFINMLVIRNRLADDLSFGQLLEQVRRTVLEAQGHQDLPFEMLVHELKPERQLNRTPFFQVVMNFDEMPEQSGETASPTLRFGAFTVGGETVKFDLNLSMSAQGGSMDGGLMYKTDLFDRSTIIRMVAHFQNLLWGVVTEPERPLSVLPLLSLAERHELIVERNDSLATAPSSPLVHELISHQAQRTPEAVAVVCGEQWLTYLDLERRAERLAKHLWDQGVGPEVPVGLCFETSPETVIAVLGILKTGGAYLGLDPEVPLERLAFTLEETGTQVVLTVGRQAGKLSDLGLERIVDLGASSTWAPCGGEAGPKPSFAENLAYLIYTSGSTGRPKGVMVEHRQLTAYLSGILEQLAATEGARFALHQSLAVDAPVTYLFGALLVGGSLHLLSSEQATDADEVADYVARHAIDYFKTAPSHLSVLRSSRRADRLLPQRLLLVGGEAAHWEEMGALRALDPNCALVNHYGPSETTVGVLTYRLGTLQEPGGARTVPLGSPLSGAEVYLLDRHLRPVPRSAVGEIWIAGRSVTRGYLSQPRLTAVAFLPHPFSDRPGERIYRSGDLARICNSGALEFLGRVDHQVKIRGYRIELGEIEAVLQGYRGVRSAAVQIWQAPTRDHRLVAYVVGEERGQDLEAELRDFLVQRLPEYMMPTVFVFEWELPRTLQGKVDRRALAEPDWTGLQTSGAYVAPRSEIEQILVAIWAEVLAVERVGVEDDFFELGGHSLLATQIIARIRREFACEVPLRRLFESPTVKSLAVVLEKAKEAGSGFTIPTLGPADRSAALPLSFAQLRLWIIDRLAPGNTIYNMPFAARVTGVLDVGSLGRAMTEIVRRHEVLRTVFRYVGAEPVQDIQPSAVVPLPMIDLSHLPAAEQLPLTRWLVGGEANRPFDLARGPLLRVGLLRLGPQDHILTATLHHSIADGWSMGILSSELGTLYDAFSNHRPSPLAELPLQYADYAIWQRGWLRGEVLEAELTYWKEKLSDLEPVLQLPTDRPHPAEQSYRGAQYGVAIATPLTEGLRQLAQKRGATPFMTVLAAFKTLLFLYSRERDLCIGTPVAGRRTVEVEGLIGCFVNMLALRTTFSDQVGFGELLNQVREVVLEADLRQDVPFEKLVEELQPERSRQYTPIFQVVFNFLNIQQPAAALALSKLELHGMEEGEMTPPVHFDLTLSMRERGDGLVGSLEYSSALFDAPTIARMGGHFEALLEAVVEDPERPLSTLATLKRSEHAQVLVEWNDTSQDLPALLLHQLFEQQSDRTPEVIAAACFEEQLSYQELDLRAKGLATFLAQHGVDSGDLVGLLLERSIDLAITILGILKVGCAFLPLDPDSPQQRLGYLINNSGAKTLVTHSGLEERIAVDGVRLFNLDFHREEIEGYRGTQPAVERTPDTLAYVIYTSGSTGRPKGVMVAHRPLVNFTLEMAEKMQLGPQDRLLQFASPAFDVVIEELFPAWSRGATVVFAAQNFLASPAELGYLLAQMAISVVELPSAFWHQSLDQMEVLGVAPPAALRLLLLGSEVPSSDRLAVWRRFGIPVLFVFGLTETAVTSTVYRVPTQGELMALPIGRPLGNTRLYILGRRGTPVPTGAIGELYIGGEGLARGYLGQPAQTAQRFLPDELSGASGLPGGRLYRTGDRVRYRADGNLEFLGRLDSQVKVRGFRVELGEVGATLMEHSAVRDAVALLREDRADDARLVAYFCSSGGVQVVPEELRAFLVERLPTYMVPAIFVELDQMPLTAHGKVDHRALPASDAERPTLSKAFVAPRSTTEQQLAAIWGEVLGVEQVGVEDSFFELGGHSIRAIQIVARVRETMGIDLDLFRLFDTPTIAELAAAVEENQAVERDEVQEIEAALAALEDLSDEEAAELLRETEAESSES